MTNTASSVTSNASAMRSARRAVSLSRPASISSPLPSCTTSPTLEPLCRWKTPDASSTRFNPTTLLLPTPYFLLHQRHPPEPVLHLAPDYAKELLLQTSRHRPVTPVGQELWDAQARAAELATYGYVDAKTILDEGTRRVQTSLDRILERERVRDEQARTGKGEKAGERIWQVSWALSMAVVLGLVVFAATKSSRRVSVSGMVYSK